MCTCTEQCAEGAVNDACPVCAEDLTQCAGKAAEPEEKPEEPETPLALVCTCTEKCTEGAVNDACPACAEDLTQCAGTAAEKLGATGAAAPAERSETREISGGTAGPTLPSVDGDPPIVVSEGEKHPDHNNYISLAEALEQSYVLTSGNYYLADDVALGQYDPQNPTQYILTVKGNVTLCLNGNVLDLMENHIEVLGEDSSLTICDCQPKIEHKFSFIENDHANYTVGTHKERCYCWTLDPNGSYVVNGGVITHGDRSNHEAPADDPENKGKGGAIYVKEGSFTFKSGNIVGNTAGWNPLDAEDEELGVSGYGGAVYVENGTFTMTGGRMVGNLASGGARFFQFKSYGGAVYLSNSQGVMTGGVIDNNFATALNTGGAVCLDAGSSFTMENGSIVQNSSSRGGVFALGESHFIMKDGEIGKNASSLTGGVTVASSVFDLYGGNIIENKGEGVSVQGATGVVTMYGGNIASNKGAYVGGVDVFSKASFAMKGGTISSNTATEAGGVQIDYGCSFTMENGTISGNTAAGSTLGNTGGVLINSGALCTITGGEIVNNTSKSVDVFDHMGGGISVLGTLNLQGGKISGNQTTMTATGATVPYGNGIFIGHPYSGKSGQLNIGGNPQIGNLDDIAIWLDDETNPDSDINGYINIQSSYSGNGGTPIAVTTVFRTGYEKTEIGYLEEPTAATGTKLVVFADESAAAAADTAKWFAPSAAMLEQEHTLEVGQSHPQKTWLTFVKYADIAPAGMTIYVGGQGYTGVVDDSGTTAGAENGFPVPGFTVTIPGVTSVEAGELGLQYKKDETTMQWDAQLYGTGATKVYRFAPDENTGNTPVRIQFLHQNGDTQTVVDSDDFVVRDYLNQTLGMRVYGEGIEQDYVTLQYDGRAYYLRTADSQMTVRSTTDHVQYGALTNDGSAVAKDAPGVVAQSGTTYTINDSNVQVADTSGVALLFDNIIENNTNKENKSNTQLLRERVDKELENLQDLNLDEGTYRHYECKYLDLVDTNNGNAWVKASQDVTVYWPLPDGTDASTKFELLHFTDMHRDMGVSQIENKIDTCIVERESVTVEGDHITFKTDGFSPYVLVWQTDTSSSQGDLVVSKTVAGSQGETDRLFNFTVTLSGSTLNGWYGGMEFKNGVATFQLPHNGRIMAEGLPAGITYTVTETEAGQDGYVTTVADNNATGRIAADGVTNVAFVNTKEETTEPVPSPDPGETPDNGSNNGSDSGSNTPAKTPAPAQNVSAAAAPAAQAAAAVIPQTGDESQPLMWAVLAAGSLGLLAVLLAAKRRRTDK